MSPKTRTKSSSSGLTPEEQQELERRGFLVVDTGRISGPLFSVVGVILGILYFFVESIHTLITVFSILILAVQLFIITQEKFTFPYKFYTKSSTRTKSILNTTDGVSNPELFLKIGGCLGIIPAVEIAGDNMILIFLFCFGTALLTREVYFFFNPLYAFGNLGSKIQSLTPRISETSENIEKEFSTDMNFRTLSDSFDTLAKDFSQISSYVIKLETIEQKANKGNLFDSQKYIGSLREDIVKPLTTLRSFLEKKKTELEASEQEMKKVRVRVGGSGKSGGNGEIENLELQSKRSEPLREELTENIGKLDVMIEKFGKI